MNKSIKKYGNVNAEGLDYIVKDLHDHFMKMQVVQEGMAKLPKNVKNILAMSNKDSCYEIIQSYLNLVKE